MLGQLDGLQVVKKEGDFPLLAGVGYNFLAGFPRPVPLVSRRKQRHADETVKVCEQTKRSQGTWVASLQSVRKLKPTTSTLVSLPGGGQESPPPTHTHTQVLHPHNPTEGHLEPLICVMSTSVGGEGGPDLNWGYWSGRGWAGSWRVSGSNPNCRPNCTGHEQGAPCVLSLHTHVD